MLSDRATRSSDYLTSLFLSQYDTSLKDQRYTLSLIDAGIPTIEYQRFTKLKTNHVSFGEPHDWAYYILTGSEAEDYPNMPWVGFPFFTPRDDLYWAMGSRASHHFHDPLDTDHPGLDNWIEGVSDIIRDYTVNRNDLTGISAANRGIGGERAAFGNEFPSAAVPANHFSWENAREYFHRALTSPLPEEQSHYYALTFIALGHVMHLVEDMAVPSHTRNDFNRDHVFSLYRQWTSYSIEKYAEKKTGFINNLKEADITSIDFTELGAFWDGRSGTFQGLSEFTNRNFLSQGTMFDRYEEPSLLECSPLFSWSDGIRQRVYLSIDDPDHSRVDHLARYTLSAGFLRAVVGKPLWDVRNHLSLDENCYEDYCNILLPRSVGYAAGVLRHFFRGRLQARFDARGRLMVTNLSGETMDGLFSLYYEAAGDGRRKPLPDLLWPMGLAPGESRQLGVLLTLPADLDPDRPLTLVFRGALGPEADAVAGYVFHLPNVCRVWKIDYHNDTNRFLTEIWAINEYTACWATWSGCRYESYHTGDRTAYWIIAFSHEPGAGPPLHLESGLTALATLVPYDDLLYNNNFPTGTAEPSGGIAFVWVVNPCNDPATLVALPATPGCYDDTQDPLTYIGLPWEAPQPEQLEPLPAVISRDSLIQFLRDLHPRLSLPAEIDSPRASFSLVTLPIMPPETFSLGDPHCVVDPRYSLPPILPENRHAIPSIWSARGIELRIGGTAVLPPVSSSSAQVFGPAYRREYVRRTWGTEGVRTWSHDPANPFTPLYTVR